MSLPEPVRNVIFSSVNPPDAVFDEVFEVGAVSDNADYARSWHVKRSCCGPDTVFYNRVDRILRLVEAAEEGSLFVYLWPKRGLAVLYDGVNGQAVLLSESRYQGGLEMRVR